MRLTRATGLALVAALLASVFVFSLRGQLYWERAVMDAAHGPVFAGIAVALLLIRAPRADTGRRGRDAYLAAFLWAVALGVATELVQHFVPDRSVSPGDVVRDAAGAALGLSLFALVERCRDRGRPGAVPGQAAVQAGRARADSPVEAWLGLVAIAAFSLLAWPLLQCARTYAERAAALPVLAPLPGRAEARFVRVHDATPARVALPERWRRSGDAGEVLALRFARGASPALELHEPSPDWRGHDVLAVDVTNPGAEPLGFVLRISDARHDWTHYDRLNLPVSFPPQSRTTLRLSLEELRKAPQARAMDLGAIANVMLYSTGPQPGEEAFVSMWLER
jgi:hypothetical protein